MILLCFLDAKVRFWVIVVGDAGRNVGLYLWSCLFGFDPPRELGCSCSGIEPMFNLRDARELIDRIGIGQNIPVLFVPRLTCGECKEQGTKEEI